MSGNLITNTALASMHALAFQGIMVTDCYPQLRDIIRHRLGEEYALLFAEPAPNPSSQSIDWYTPVQGTARPLLDLPVEEQNPLRERLAGMAQEVQRLADELKQAPDHIKRTQGNILELGLLYPGDQCLFVVGGQPVFTCWGFGPGTVGASAQTLTHITTITPPIITPPIKKENEPEKGNLPPITEAAKSNTETTLPPTPGPQVSRGFGWLWWIIPLLLLLLLLWLLFTSFNGRPALLGIDLFRMPLPPFCEEKALSRQKELEALENAADALRREIKELQALLDEHVALCRPKPEPITEPAVKPKELVIPDKPQDMAFLQGHWSCETGLVKKRTKEPIVVEFEFDSTGKGKGHVFEKNNSCTGVAQGRMTPEGELVITLDEQVCRDGSRYTKQRILCRSGEGIGAAAVCLGQNADGSRWDARFIRTR